VKDVSDQLRHCYLQLKEDSGLLDPETLHSFGIISDEQHQVLLRTSILEWLCGGEILAYLPAPDELSFREVLLRTSEINFSCVMENEEDVRLFDGLRSPVVLSVSCSVLEVIISLLEEQGRADATPAFQRLLGIIRNGLGNPELPVLEHVNHLHNLGALNMNQRWQLYR
jgi:hypothetical protein